MLALSVSTGYVVADNGDWKVAAGIAFATAAVGVGLLAPAVFLTAFILVRPLVDWLSDTEIAVGINAAGFLALLVIGVTVVALARPRTLVPAMPGIGYAFAVVLGVSALAAIPALVNYGDEVGTKPFAEVVRLASLFAIYLLARDLFATLDRVRQLFVMVGLSGVVPALVGVYQWMRGVTPDEELTDLAFGRLEGTFFGPTPFAAYLAICALILIALPKADLKLSVRVAALAPMLVALVGTYSRTGWAIFLIGLLLLGLRERKGVVVVFAVAIAFMAVSLPNFTERALRNESTVQEGYSGSVLPTSLGWRGRNWEMLLGEYTESPLIGHGLRTSEAVNPNRSARVKGEATPDNPSGRIGFSPHSTLVKGLVEGGPLMLASFAVLFAVLIAATRRISRDRSEISPYARLLMAFWITMVIAGVTSTDSLNLTAVLFALFALTGAVVGTRAARSDDVAGVVPAASGRAG